MPTHQTKPPASPLAPETILTIVRSALRAPSVRNSQPWLFRITPVGLELRVDLSRRTLPSEPCRRNAILSCGTVLHHIEIAALGLGWRPAIRRRMRGVRAFENDPRLLAQISFTPAYPTRHDVAAAAILRERRTDRRHFTAWPVPPRLLGRLCSVAESRGAVALPLSGVSERVAVSFLAHRAWVHHSTADGVPLRRRNGISGMYELDDFDVRDPTIILGGPDDEPEGWLRSGEALSALWLQAHATGLSVVPLSQIIEVEQTRRELMDHVLGARWTPHLLVRLGWQPLGLGNITRTPRRPLREFLDP